MLVASAALLTGSLALAHESQAGTGQEHAASPEGHHAFVHPFVAHMGMPDEPGEISLRLMSLQERNIGSVSGTYGFHVEAGIADRWGLHLRNDKVSSKKMTEMMLQYAVLRSDSGENGLALIGEVEFPTGPTTDNQNKHLFGVSFAYLWAPIVSVNSVVHYDPQEKMVEWEIAFVSRLTEKIFPILEFRGEASKDMSLANALFAWKFKAQENSAFGLGYQVPISKDREYDSQLILAAEFNFN